MKLVAIDSGEAEFIQPPEPRRWCDNGLHRGPPAGSAADSWRAGSTVESWRAGIGRRPLDEEAPGGVGGCGMPKKPSLSRSVEAEDERTANGFVSDSLGASSKGFQEPSEIGLESTGGC
mmetsp:Transcript_11370/g.18197  ORF Transcript_11370/g.18197 Transcript_11370/m.18197 type:complete len:119 (+) Transcript_11370:691-1047(+)